MTNFVVAHVQNIQQTDFVSHIDAGWKGQCIITDMLGGGQYSKRVVIFMWGDGRTKSVRCVCVCETVLLFWNGGTSCNT